MKLKLGLLALFIFAFLLVSCGPSDAAIAQTQTAMATNTPTNTATPIPTPSAHYQLTYVSACQEDTSCMYALDVACLESEQPCFGEPQLLFEVSSRRSQDPRFPISSYNWSPDGQRIVVDATGVDGSSDIFVGDWNGQNWTNLTNNPNYEARPTWSPDGRQIAFIAKIGEDPHYYTQPFKMNSDGTEVTQVLSKLEIQDKSVLSVYWSPDGKRVAFSFSDKNGFYQIHVVNLDGSNWKQLTSRSEDHWLFGFSPDGEWIMYTRALSIEGSENYNIFLLRSDGLMEKAVFQNSKGFLTGLAWSAAGDWIAFTARNDEGNYEIYLIRPDGTGLFRVTQGNIDAGSPAWRVIFP